MFGDGVRQSIDLVKAIDGQCRYNFGHVFVETANFEETLHVRVVGDL